MLAEQLLTFSRLASRTDLTLHEPVSLLAVCCDVFELDEPLLERHGQSLGLDAPRDARIDGEPVPEQEVERIFEPYYRLRPGTVSGAGLGLAIVREIANQCRARISIGRKASGQGCVVTVAFPAQARIHEVHAAVLH
jgi:signal transduction histidine kinase